MEELRDLKKLETESAALFQKFDGADFILPEIFKNSVKEINSGKISYLTYSAIIETSGDLNIYLPNQWFYIASFFTNLYNELQKYRSYALQICSKERLKELDKKELSGEEENKLNKVPITEPSKTFLRQFITNYKWWKGAKSIDRGDFYVSPILSVAKLVNSSQSFIADLCAFIAERPDLAMSIIAAKEYSDKIKSIMKTVTSLSDPSISDTQKNLIRAIRTKPFVLLAGISGTGKSRIVRKLAQACWEPGSAEWNAHKPSNFEMVQVKPNWHDSSELIGYVSRISGKPQFIAGDFLKFIAKAWENPTVPYFLCLDEMNLAPVEQYFAEYLSVVESRKLQDDGTIVTDPLLKIEDEDWYHPLVASITTSDETRNRFLTEGIAIPQNLIVIGTVNMDETTYSFSRKVLDRAMTIEMNEVDLRGGLHKADDHLPRIEPSQILADAVEGFDVYEANKDACDKAIEYLDAVNAKLDKTPFKVAYRTRNEFLIYVVNALKLAGEDANENTIAEALDEVTSMKILSRIEGDKRKVGFLPELKQIIKDGLAKIDGVERSEESSISLAKLKTMKDRLDSGYTSFWD